MNSRFGLQNLSQREAMSMAAVDSPGFYSPPPIPRSLP